MNDTDTRLMRKKNTKFRPKSIMKANVESPHMKMAVKDFQIRAFYMFWMDVTVKEAQRMFVEKREEDLVSSFMLDLPEICLDIITSQFYIVINVARNVLLAVPPQMSRTEKEKTEAEARKAEAKKDSLMEIVRDPHLLARHDVKMSSADLDLKSRNHREEMRILIEDSLKRKMDVEMGMARFTELLIGKGSWILRSGEESTELIETGFTGIYASFNFHEDRFASHIPIVFTASHFVLM